LMNSGAVEPGWDGTREGHPEPGPDYADSDVSYAE
jgi:hypothetical protein